MIEKNKFETVICNLCGKDDYNVICKSHSKYSRDIFNVVQCKNCGLIYINPRLNTQKSIEGYKEDKKTIEYYNHLWNKRVNEGTFLIKKYLLKNNTGKDLAFLDVGAGTGAMMYSAKKLGFTTIRGFELNTLAAEHGNNRHPYGKISNIDICNSKQVSKVNERFDVILCHHTLEHVYDPDSAIKNMKFLLKERGLLCISVPNTDFFIMQMIKFFRLDSKGVFDPSAHIFHFTSKILDLFLKKHKLKIIVSGPLFKTKGHLNTFSQIFNNKQKKIFLPITCSIITVAQKNTVNNLTKRS